MHEKRRTPQCKAPPLPLLPNHPYQRQVREQQRAHDKGVHGRALDFGDDARCGDLPLKREMRHACLQGAAPALTRSDNSPLRTSTTLR